MSDKKLLVVPALLKKAHVDTYTRKDGVVVQAHDTKVQAAPAFNGPAVAAKHDDKMERKATEWNHSGYEGKKIPHADVAGAPEFTHKEVYGHDGKTSPAGTDFHPDFAKKGVSHFVLKHPGGQRSFVNTEGGKYARYHAPVAEPEREQSAPAKPFSAAPGKWGGHKVTGGGVSHHFNDPKAAAAHADRMNAVHAAGRMDEMHAAAHAAAQKHTPFSTLKEAGSDREDFKETSRGGIKAALHEAYAAGRGKAGGKGADAAVAEAHKHHLADTHESLETTNSGEDFKDTSKGSLAAALHHAFARGHADKAATAAKPKAAPKKPVAPTTVTQNEGHGFHGEAYTAHLRQKHGPDDYYAKASEQDHNDANAAAAKRFSEAAHSLVQAGHFEKHEHARDYLDATHGRHLHDAAPSGDVTKVPWLAKDVQRFKQKRGLPLQKSVLLVRPDLLKAGGSNTPS